MATLSTGALRANPTACRVLFITADGSLWPTELYPTEAKAATTAAALLGDPNVRDARVVPVPVRESIPEEPPQLPDIAYFDPADEDIDPTDLCGYSQEQQREYEEWAAGCEDDIAG